jgi:hypothetical protein
MHITGNSLPGRRGLLGGAVAALAGTVAATLPRAAPVAETCPDAVIVGLCDEFCACVRALWSINDGPEAEPDDDLATSASAPFWDRQRVLVAAIFRSRANTMRGVVAVAHALAIYAVDGELSIELDSQTIGGQLSLTLMREALRIHREVLSSEQLRSAEAPARRRMSRATVATVGLDADLFVACETFHAGHEVMRQQRCATAAEEASLDVAMDRWYAALAAAVAIPAFTPEGRREKARVAYTALNDVLDTDEVNYQREEFAALSVLAEFANELIDAV